MKYRDTLYIGDPVRNLLLSQREESLGILSQFVSKMLANSTPPYAGRDEFTLYRAFRYFSWMVI
jgi:hypothetical protein